MEQYSGHNTILFHSLLGEKGEDTDSLLTETVKNKISSDISAADIDRIHGIGAHPPHKPLPSLCPLSNQVRLDRLLLSLFGTTTGENFI